MAKGIKTGGREAGTPNKLTFQTRQLLVNVLADEFENLSKTLSQLTPAEKIDAICKLAKYALPTMTSLTSTIAEQAGLKDEAETLDQIKSKNETDNLFLSML
jgi:hypothetical protein